VVGLLRGPGVHVSRILLGMRSLWPTRFDPGHSHVSAHPLLHLPLAQLRFPLLPFPFMALTLPILNVPLIIILDADRVWIILLAPFLPWWIELGQPASPVNLARGRDARVLAWRAHGSGRHRTPR
jgi:hypothetical protein